MTNTVLLKRSSTANAVPTAGQLQQGELAINYNDGNLFFKDATNAVSTIASTKFVSVSGNVTGGSFFTVGVASATGNVTGGNVNSPGIVSAQGDVVGASFFTIGIVSATGNVTGGNVNTAGVVSAQGNVIGASFFTVGEVSATGNVTGGNLLTSGGITATGNIWGGGTRSTSSAFPPTMPPPGVGDIWFDTTTDAMYRYTFDGTSYYWIDEYGSTISTGGGPVIVNYQIINGTSGITIASPGANAVVSINNVPNIAVFSGSGVDVSGHVSATGNVTGLNVNSTVSLGAAAYANTTARDSAIPIPAAGMIVFNIGNVKFQGYTGSSWVDLN